VLIQQIQVAPVPHTYNNNIPKFPEDIIENLTNFTKKDLQQTSRKQTSYKKVHPAKSSPPTITTILESHNVPEGNPEVDLEDLIDGYLDTLNT
ncbi:23256_t:CDS:2, partial [Racocetra persica]